MAFTSYVVDNDRRFRDAIARASEQCGDLRLPFSQILKDFYRSEAAIFILKSQGQYPPFKNSGGHYSYTKNGRVWVGNKDGSMSPYQKYKIKHAGFDYPLLVGPDRKGHSGGSLSRSLLNQSDPMAIANVGKTFLQIGTKVQYGIYHQSDDPRSKIPLRKFLFIGPEASRFATSDQMGRPGRWLDYMNDFVLAKMRQSGAAT
jgi:hypothetical protein